MKNTLIICLVNISVLLAQPSIKLTKFSENLVAPVGMISANDGTGRLFIIEQRGLIYIIDKNRVLQEKPFLDIRNALVKLTARYDERGLLGLVFHPKFKENGRFFIYYSAAIFLKGMDHVGKVAEYTVDPKNPNFALQKEKVILQVPQPEWNHNGGQLLFGKDGYLYIGLGDGGSGGDPHGKTGNGQNINTNLGKILRIDVDSKAPYAIPQDNPFVNKDGSDEIFAWGLRNPWRFSQDKVTGRIFCADVGQNKYEEVNIIEKGKNYGWKIMEGLHCFEPENNCPKDNLMLPITEYDRSEGSSVTGGYVYRGKNIPFLIGKYVFADWRGVLFCLTEQPDKSWKREQIGTNWEKFKNLNINSLAEDDEGELYLIVQDLDGPFQLTGQILKLEL